MKLKNNLDKKIIDWKSYKEELENRKTFSVFNECERDLHTMTMKEGLFEDSANSFEYKNALKEMTTFNKTNLDYFRYEKELTLGEFNN